MNQDKMIGKKFGRWEIIGVGEKSKDGHRRWQCKCQCEKHTVRLVVERDLISGKSKSCGCLQKEISRKSHTKHGQSNTKLYFVWTAMKQRIDNVNYEHYKDYGGRGIKYCSDWSIFKNFYEWAIKNGYKDGLSLERINVNGDYCPENCCWIELKLQKRNRRTSRKITINGIEKCLAEWCEIYNIPYSVVSARINQLNWEPEKALSYPIRKK